MKRIKFLLLVLLNFSAVLLSGQFDEIIDLSYGQDGKVILNLDSLENIRGTKLEIDQFNNQFLIVSQSTGFSVIKLFENGDIDTAFGNEGLLFINVSPITRLSETDISENYLFVIINDFDSETYLYSIDITGNNTQDAFTWKKLPIEPTNGYQYKLSVVEEGIKIVVTNPSLELFDSNMYSLNFGTNLNILSIDTIGFGNSDFSNLFIIKPVIVDGNEIYVGVEHNSLDTFNDCITIRKHRAANLDSSFAENGILFLCEDSLTLRNIFSINDQIVFSVQRNNVHSFSLLDISGNLVNSYTKELPTSVDSLNPIVGINYLSETFTDEGIYFLEIHHNNDWTTDHYLTRFTNEIELDSTFGTNGSYRIPFGSIKNSDANNRLYFCTLDNNIVELLRTRTNITNTLSPLESSTHSIYNVFPNPAQNYITISSEIVKPKYKYQIFNSSGRLLSQGIGDKNEKTIDISDFSSGVFFLIIEKDKQRNYFRIVRAVD